MPTLLSRLHGVKRAGAGWVAFCPGHEDRHNPSLSIREMDGKILLKCFVGCPVDRIAAALALEVSDLFGAGRADPKRTTRDIVATYDYRDEVGTLLYQVCRFDPKDFRPRRPDGQGGWVWGLGDVRRVLHRLPDLATGTAGAAAA